jgi:hypothetical protein
MTRAVGVVVKYKGECRSMQYQSPEKQNEPSSKGGGSDINIPDRDTY